MFWEPANGKSRRQDAMILWWQDWVSAIKNALAKRRARSLSSLPVHWLMLPKCVGEENMSVSVNASEQLQPQKQHAKGQDNIWSTGQFTQYSIEDYNPVVGVWMKTLQKNRLVLSRESYAVDKTGQGSTQEVFCCKKDEENALTLTSSLWWGNILKTVLDRV